MKKKPSQIAIDGPAASGKTTVGKIIADQLSYLFFDTGLMYRVATYVALMAQEKQKEISVVELIRNSDITLSINQSTGETDVLLDGKAITDQLHIPRIDAHVSEIAANPDIRAILTEQQRKIGKKGQVVLVGRDIGTVVLPDAELKIYLLASAEKRAERRALENQKMGLAADFQQILEGIRHRDQIDSNRATAPLKPAQDAILIDTDNLSIQQVVESIMDQINS